MKTKRAMYAALGWLTYKAGKLWAKRRGRQFLKPKAH
jgi:hypothetical protein